MPEYQAGIATGAETGAVAAVAAGAAEASPTGTSPAGATGATSAVPNGPDAPLMLVASGPECELPAPPPTEAAPPPAPSRGRMPARGASPTSKAKPTPSSLGPTKATWKLSGASAPSTRATEVEPVCPLATHDDATDVRSKVHTPVLASRLPSALARSQS